MALEVKRQENISVSYTIQSHLPVYYGRDKAIGNPMRKLVLIVIPLIAMSLTITAEAIDSLVIVAGADVTGTAVDDGMITSEINNLMRKDQLLKGFQISVVTRNKTVELSGSVDSLEARDRATQLAKSAKGVKRVYNLIKVSK